MKIGANMAYIPVATCGTYWLGAIGEMIEIK